MTQYLTQLVLTSAVIGALAGAVVTLLGAFLVRWLDRKRADRVARARLVGEASSTVVRLQNIHASGYGNPDFVNADLARLRELARDPDVILAIDEVTTVYLYNSIQSNDSLAEGLLNPELTPALIARLTHTPYRASVSLVELVARPAIAKIYAFEASDRCVKCEVERASVDSPAPRR